MLAEAEAAEESRALMAVYEPALAALGSASASACPTGTTRGIRSSLKVYLCGPQRRRHEDERVASHEKHLDLPLRRADDLLLRLLVDLLRRHRLLDVAEHHVQVIVVRVELPPQFPISLAFHVDALVDGQPDEVQRFSALAGHGFLVWRSDFGLGG